MDKKASPRTDRIAESLFEQLCLDAGCAVNRADDDQNGWDYIVEFPGTGHTGPPDTRPPALTCLAQIKSTRMDASSVRIKLSNALKFAKNPLPCFIALIVFDRNGKTPTQFYLKHFYEEQISQALKSGRRAHADGKTALNRTTIPVRFGPNDLTAPDQLTNRIALTVPKPGEYAATKANYYEKVGYETGYGHGKLTLASEHAEAFVDALLGKDTPVVVQRMVFHDERFGIVDPKAVFDGPGTLRITPEPKSDCRVVVRQPGAIDQIVMQGKVYTVGPGLPLELRKIRIATDILEFTCGVGPGLEVKFGDFTASFGTKERTSIDRLDQFAGLWSGFEKGPLDLEVWIKGERFLHGQIDGKADESRGYFSALRRVTHELATFVEKEMRPPDMEFELADFADISAVSDFIQVLRGSDVTVKVSTDMTRFPKVQSYVAPVFLEFGGFLFFAVARYRIKKVVIKGNSATIKLADPTIHCKAILKGPRAEHTAFIREETQAVEKLCARDGEALVLMFQSELPATIVGSIENAIDPDLA